MTAASFYFPYSRDKSGRFEHFDDFPNAATLFAPLRFATGSLNNLQKGHVPYFGGIIYGESQRCYWTFGALNTAGAADVNEIFAVIDANHDTGVFHHAFHLRAPVDYSSSNQPEGYFVRLSNTTLQINTRTGFSSTVVAFPSLSSDPRTTSNLMCIRVRAEGPTVYVKAWGLMEPEPAAWTGSWTDPDNLYPTGIPYILQDYSGAPGSSGMMQMFSMATGEAAPSLLGEISGTVQVDGVAAARRVVAVSRLYPDLTAETMSDPTTGDFTLYVRNDHDWMVIAMAADADTQNAVIFDKITPV